jgi:hypothetical protein
MKTNIVEAAGKVLDHLSAKDGQVFFDDTVLSPRSPESFDNKWLRRSGGQIEENHDA